MISGVHLMLYTAAAEEVRAFFREVLEFEAVDAVGGWWIMGLLPGEMGVHPAERDARWDLYLMTDDLDAAVEKLRAKGVECGERQQADWGVLTSVPLPNGGAVGLYQPAHPSALRR